MTLSLHNFSILLKAKSSMGKDILWTFSSQMLIILCAFIITKLVSNIYSVEEFGQYNVIKKSASVFTFVMLGGMGITLPRYLPIFSGKLAFRQVSDLQIIAIVYVLILSLIVFAFSMLFANRWCEVLAGTDDLSVYMILLLYAFSLTVSSLLFSYYRGINDFRKYSVSQILIQLAFIASVIFVGKHSLVFLFLIWSVVGLLVSFAYFLREMTKSRYILLRSFNLHRIRSLTKTIVGYSLPRLVGDFFLFSFSAFPVIYLSRVMSMTDVAYYSVGLTIMNMATPLFSFLGVVLLPYVSGAMTKGTFNEANRFIRKMQYLYLIVSVSITVLFWLIMPFIIKFFFSAQYLPSQELSRYMLLAVIPQAFYLLYRNPIDAISVVPYNTIILLLSFVVLVSLYLFSSSLSDYVFSFIIASSFQGFVSMLTWLYLKRKLVTNTSKK